jgi:hypothetical protein
LFNREVVIEGNLLHFCHQVLLTIHCAPSSKTCNKCEQMLLNRYHLSPKESSTSSAHPSLPSPPIQQP